MTSLYYNVMQQKCELERQVITNALSFATLQPDEFAYRHMKGPGYMAVTTGEVTHVIKCIPVDVMIRKTEEENAAMNYRQCIASKKLRSSLHLNRNGIYSEKDLEKLRDHIMFPAEKPALLNIVARGLTGHCIDTNAVSMYNLLDEATLNKIAENAASKVWNGFVTFGSATAGMFGIMVVIRIIKLVIDTAIHGYALHTVYRWTPEEPPALPTEPPVLIEIPKPNENARSTIESATISFPLDTT
ncbi:hypothetical protein RF55_21767 [Lasius niger]|uniref:Uncharacterized protein n=1 Tax=Lasius niger TaxID=67767 RepID=A0A0J7JXP1_LASNI|nr:hypothetical protein RF55_21767 [Lasius niger]